MTDKIDALDVANFFIEQAAARGLKISHMKLQKLLYYAQGYYLANKDEKLFDCSIQKWPFGPVIPIVYRKFKNTGLAYDVQVHPAGDSRRLPLPIQGFLRQIWNIYGRFTGVQLSELSHRESPWLDTEMYQEMEADCIKAYFKKILSERKAAATRAAAVL